MKRNILIEEKPVTTMIKEPLRKDPKIRPFSVEIYDSMIKNGILTENDNVELLNGAIIEKMPKGTKHSSITNYITKYFYRNFIDEVVIRVQDPVILDDFSEPESDLVLCKTPIENYNSKHPAPEDILLIIEVSDTTLYFDRNDKALAYAAAGIRQYLIVNVENNAIEDYREPHDDGFQSKQTYHAGEKFSLISFPEIEIAVEDF